MAGRHEPEWVHLEEIGEGYLVPNGRGQKHELMLNARLNSERHEEITVRFLGGTDGMNTQGERQSDTQGRSTTL